MDEVNRYLTILEDSLEIKIKSCQKIYGITQKQEKILSQDDVDFDAFDLTIKDKQILINKINQLDEGFNSIYSKMEKDIKNNIDKYRDKLIVLQKYIKEIMELGVKIQILEQKNKVKVDKYLSKNKNKIKTFKKSRSTVAAYYKNMSNANTGQSYFLDSKK